MSREAEQSLLGGLMLDNSKLDLVNLEADNFESLDHKVIFQAIEEINAQDLSFDLITVSDYLEKNKKINLVGGFEYIRDLANNSSSSNIEVYAKVIKRDYNSQRLKQAAIKIADIADSYEDFDNKLEESLGLFDEFNMQGEKDLVSIKSLVGDYARELERRVDLEGMDGLSTGFDKIDERLQGLKGGELYVVAGRPASGKSTYGLNIANVVAKDLPVIFFSMEMPKLQVVQRGVASLGNVELNWLKNGLRNTEEDGKWPLAARGMSVLNDSKLIIDDNGYQTIQTIKVKCKKQGKLGLVVVDYIQLMSGKGNNRTEIVGDISRGLKQLAKELDCPVIALSQLNRSLESRKDKRPMMSDLRESGAIEQDADVIQFIYRDEVYYPNYDQNKGFAEINTAKFRDGEIGTDFLTTELHKSRFGNVTSFTYQPYEETNNSKAGFTG